MIPRWLITSIKRLKIFAVVIYQAAMEVMDTIAYASFAAAKNERGGIAQELERIFDLDTFIQPGMGELPFIGHNLEFILNFDKGVETQGTGDTILDPEVGYLAANFKVITLLASCNSKGIPAAIEVRPIRGCWWGCRSVSTS